MLVGFTDPQVPAVTPVAHVTVQLTVVVLEPVTDAVKVWVRLVMTLWAGGEIVMETPEVVLFPQPKAPSTTRASNEENFHRLIRVLPKLLDIRRRRSLFPALDIAPNARCPRDPVACQNVRLTVKRSVRMGSKKFVRCGLLCKLKIAGAAMLFQ